LSAARGPDAAIFLVGFMASGKTTVGRVLAETLGWEFADTDELIERTEGRSIEAIFRESGEGRFREAEWEALRSLTGRRRVVVATGGGLFLGVSQRGLIRASGVSCWLDVPLELASVRLQTGEPRPLWEAADPLSRRAMFERRRAAYALADWRIDATRGEPDELAHRIDALKNSLWR